MAKTDGMGNRLVFCNHGRTAPSCIECKDERIARAEDALVTLAQQHAQSGIDLSCAESALENACTIIRSATQRSEEPETTEVEPEQSSEDAWEISLSVPPSRRVDIFAAFTLQEQMDAIGCVLQRRMDAILEDAILEGK